MSERLRGLAEAARHVAAELRANWRSFVAYDLLCKLLSVALFAPVSAWFLGAVLRWSGDQVVSNYDLISFFLSLEGLVWVAAASAGGFAVLFFELGGLALIAIGARQGERVSAGQTLRYLAGHFPALLAIGLRQFLFLGAVGGVLLAVIATTKATLLGGGDIYFYLNVRPPQFWLAVFVVSAAATATAIVMVVLLLRWIFAVPLLLLESASSRTAMSDSYRLVREAGVRRIVSQLTMWALLMLLLLAIGWLAQSLVQWAAMRFAGDRVGLVLRLAGLLMASELLVSVLLGMIATMSLALVIANLYARMRPNLRLPDVLLASRDPAATRKPFPLAGAAISVAVLLIGMAAFLSYTMIDHIQLDESVAVTAHRGSARVAPENTLAALRQAIEDGADFAEIDVQETADGVVILMHDVDLRRVAGVDRAVGEVTYDEIRDLDVGSWFSDEFKDERIPTLQEAIEAIRGRLQLNIELKSNEQSQELEAKVIEIVKEAGFENDCFVTSLKYSSIQKVAQQTSDLRRGLIVTATIGDPTDVDADLIALNARMVTRDLVARAHSVGKEVHVWTVNEPEQMLNMIHMGVDNILTSAPDVLAELLREREEMSDVEKTMLFVADFLSGRL